MDRISSLFRSGSPISSPQRDTSSQNKSHVHIPTLEPSIQASLKQENMAMLNKTDCGDCAGDACGASCGMTTLKSLAESKDVDQSSLNKILKEMGLSESDSTKEVSKSSTGNNPKNIKFMWVFN